MSATLILNGSLIPRHLLPVYLICDPPHVANLIYTTPPTSVPLLRSLPPQECPVAGLGGGCEQCSRNLPMVVLGVLARFLSNGHQRLYWKPAKFRAAQSPRRPQSRLAAHPRAAIQLLPDGVRVRHGRYFGWRTSRTRPRPPRTSVLLRVDDARLLPACELGVGCPWLGAQVGCS